MPYSLLDLPQDVLVGVLIHLDLIELVACEKTCRTLFKLIHKTTSLQFRKLRLSYGTSAVSIRGTSSADKLADLQRREDAWANLRFKPFVDYKVCPALSERRPLLSGDYFYGMRFENTTTRFVQLHLPTGALNLNWYSFRSRTEDNVIHFMFDPSQDLFACLQQNCLDEDHSETWVHIRSASTGGPHPDAPQAPYFFGEGYNFWNGRPLRLVGSYILLVVDRLGDDADAVIVMNWKTGRMKEFWSPPKEYINPEQEGILIVTASFLAQRTLLVHWDSCFTIVTFSDLDDNPTLTNHATLAFPDTTCQIRMLNTHCPSHPQETPYSQMQYESQFDSTRRPFDDDVVVFQLLRPSNPGLQRNILVFDRQDLLALGRLDVHMRDTAHAQPYPWREWTRTVRLQVVPMDDERVIIRSLRASGNRVACMEGPAPGQPGDVSLKVHDFRRFVQRRQSALMSTSTHGLSQNGAVAVARPSPHDENSPTLTQSITRTWGGCDRVHPNFGAPQVAPRPYYTVSRGGYERGMQSLLFNDRWFVRYDPVEDENCTLVRVYALDIP